MFGFLSAAPRPTQTQGARKHFPRGPGGCGTTFSAQAPAQAAPADRCVLVPRPTTPVGEKHPPFPRSRRFCSGSRRGIKRRDPSRAGPRAWGGQAGAPGPNVGLHKPALFHLFSICKTKPGRVEQPLKSGHGRIPRQCPALRGAGGGGGSPDPPPPGGGGWSDDGSKRLPGSNCGGLWTHHGSPPGQGVASARPRKIDFDRDFRPPAAAAEGAQGRPTPAQALRPRLRKHCAAPARTAPQWGKKRGAGLRDAFAQPGRKTQGTPELIPAGLRSLHFPPSRHLAHLHSSWQPVPWLLLCPERSEGCLVSFQRRPSPPKPRTPENTSPGVRGAAEPPFQRRPQPEQRPPTSDTCPRIPLLLWRGRTRPSQGRPWGLFHGSCDRLREARNPAGDTKIAKIAFRVRVE